MVFLLIPFFFGIYFNRQSEKRKQDLLAEIVLEEQRGRELSKIVQEMLPDTKNNAMQKPSRTRKVHVFSALCISIGFLIIHCLTYELNPVAVY